MQRQPHTQSKISSRTPPRQHGQNNKCCRQRICHVGVKQRLYQGSQPTTKLVHILLGKQSFRKTTFSVRDGDESTETMQRWKNARRLQIQCSLLAFVYLCLVSVLLFLVSILFGRFLNHLQNRKQLSLLCWRRTHLSHNTNIIGAGNKLVLC